MDAKKVTVVGIIAILIGLLIGYLFWGSQTKAQSELDALKAKLAEAQKSLDQEKAMSAKVQALEAQLRQMTENLNKEKAAREQLQARISKGKK